MIDKIWQLKLKCEPTNVMVDAASPEIVEAIKREIGESTDWNYIHDKIARSKKYNVRGGYYESCTGPLFHGRKTDAAACKAVDGRAK